MASLHHELQGAEELVILGDIGGTRTRLHLCIMLLNNVSKTVFTSENYTSKYSSISDHLESFLVSLKYNAQYGSNRIQRCCLAVCGVVTNGRALLLGAQFGKNGWIVDAADLSKLVNVDVKIINDFEAIGYSLPQIINRASTNRNLLNVNNVVIEPIHQENPKNNQGVMVCLGAGTGLGQCFLIYNSSIQRYEVYPSEGGCSEFVPRSKNEWRLKEFLIKKYNDEDDFVDIAQVVSGSGIYNIYLWLVEESKTSVGSSFGFYYEDVQQDILNEILAEGQLSKQPASLIAKYGTGTVVKKNRIQAGAHDSENNEIYCDGENNQGVGEEVYVEPKCPLCAYAIELFLDCLGAEAANLALRFQATGGVYIAGGSVAYKLIYDVCLQEGDDQLPDKSKGASMINGDMSFISEQRKERIRRSYLKNSRSLPAFAQNCPLFLVNLPGDELALIGSSIAMQF